MHSRNTLDVQGVIATTLLHSLDFLVHRKYVEQFWVQGKTIRVIYAIKTIVSQTKEVQ